MLRRRSCGPLRKDHRRSQYWCAAGPRCRRCWRPCARRASITAASSSSRWRTGRRCATWSRSPRQCCMAAIARPGSRCCARPGADSRLPTCTSSRPATDAPLAASIGDVATLARLSDDGCGRLAIFAAAARGSHCRPRIALPGQLAEDGVARDRGTGHRRRPVRSRECRTAFLGARPAGDGNGFATGGFGDRHRGRRHHGFAARQRDGERAADDDPPGQGARVRRRDRARPAAVAATPGAAAPVLDPGRDRSRAGAASCSRVAAKTKPTGSATTRSRRG